MEGTTAEDPGTAVVDGAGGNGGSASNPEGIGGNRARPGNNANVTVDGAAGKAISGGNGNIINNINGGQSFGLID